MKLSFLIGFLFVCLAGCAAKQVPADSNLAPTREELLQTFEPSGSWCLDALVVNFLNTGCSRVVSQHEGNFVVIQCAAPQLGATDRFSNGRFVAVPRWGLGQNSIGIENVQLTCLDGQLGVFITTD